MRGQQGCGVLKVAPFPVVSILHQAVLLLVLRIKCLLSFFIKVLYSNLTGFPFPLRQKLWVGVMIQTQPFFIAGIEDYDEAKSSAFGAMAMFVVTFVASLLGMWYDSQNKIEETAPLDGPEAEYHLSTGDVPTYGTSS